MQLSLALSILSEGYHFLIGTCLNGMGGIKVRMKSFDQLHTCTLVGLHVHVHSTNLFLKIQYSTYHLIGLTIFLSSSSLSISSAIYCPTIDSQSLVNDTAYSLSLKTATCAVIEEILVLCAWHLPERG